MSQLSLLGEPAPDPAQSQWFTPQALADRIARWARVAGLHVLEPSAGSGNLVRAALRAGADMVTAVELDHRWSDALAELETTGAVDVYLPARFPDALCAEIERYDVALMNPPYEDGQDGAFIAAALDFAPRVVALVPSSTLHGQTRLRELWSWARVTRRVNLSQRPRFGGEHSASRDHIVIEVMRRDDAPGNSVQEEWWR